MIFVKEMSKFENRDHLPISSPPAPFLEVVKRGGMAAALDQIRANAQLQMSHS